MIIEWLRYWWAQISLYGIACLFGRRNYTPSALGYELRSRVSRFGFRTYYRAKKTDPY